jgi:hypothetical protein
MRRPAGKGAHRRTAGSLRRGCGEGRGGVGCWDHRQGDGEGHGGASPSLDGWGGKAYIYAPHVPNGLQVTFTLSLTVTPR